MQNAPKVVWSIPYVSLASFPSLEQNFIAYRSYKVSSGPYCIFEIHQLWQWGFSRVYSNCCCSCSFQTEIIKIGQSSHKMYSNNILNFQNSISILNICTKKFGSLLNVPHTHTRTHTYTHIYIYIYIYMYIYIKIELYMYFNYIMIQSQRWEERDMWKFAKIYGSILTYSLGFFAWPSAIRVGWGIKVSYRFKTQIPSLQSGYFWVGEEWVTSITELAYMPDSLCICESMSP